MDTISSVSVETRILVSGNLCVKDSSTIEGANTEVLVGGQLKTFGSASVGRNGSNPAGLVEAAGQCRYESGSVGTCNTSRKVWATVVDTTPALQPAPAPDWTYWYANASPGALSTCTGANKTGTPPVFDNDTTQDRDAPDANLTPGSTYTCKTYLGADQRGELSWNNTSKTLTIRGVIFIDGDIKITQKALYSGQGTLYTTGSLEMNGSYAMCGARIGGAGIGLQLRVRRLEPEHEPVHDRDQGRRKRLRPVATRRCTWDRAPSGRARSTVARTRPGS